MVPKVLVLLLACVISAAALSPWDNEAQRWLSSQSDSNELLVSLILRQPSLTTGRHDTQREKSTLRRTQNIDISNKKESTLRRTPLQAVQQTIRRGIRLHAEGMLMFDDATLGQGENQTLLINASITAISGSVTAETVDTGNGATEVHAMDQPVTTTSIVNFDSVSAGTVTGDSVVTTSGVDVDTLNSEVVKLTGDQTIEGAKTFTGSVFVDDIIVSGLSFATWLALAQEPCPEYSTGTSIATGCICLHTGNVSITGVEPFYSNTCDSFVSQWTLDNVSDLSITLPLNTRPGVYDFVVEWGDGNSSVITSESGSWSHSYAAVGTYTMIITGVLEGFAFRNTGDKTKIIDILQWGTKFSFGLYSGYFWGCSNLQISATDSPDLSATPELTKMFKEASAFNSNISGWDVSRATRLDYMFDGANAFNIDLSSWDTSKVTSMDRMFRDAHVFTGDLSGWDVTTATDMVRMFSKAYAFTSNLTSWDVSQVTACEGFAAEALLASDAFPDFADCDPS